MLLLAAILTVLVIAFLASAAAWAIGAHVNAGRRTLSPATMTRPAGRLTAPRIELPTPLD
jgi:hypothetical protein